jgi:hypothetical protein
MILAAGGYFKLFRSCAIEKRKRDTPQDISAVDLLARRTDNSKMETKVIRSVEQFIREVKADSAGWPCVWFRGEPKVATPLLPKLYRLKGDGTPHDENALLQSFRLKAPTFAIGPCPDRGATDQWLFLAQHVGLPTRLLDWSESALVGLYFALLESEPSYGFSTQ